MWDGCDILPPIMALKKTAQKKAANLDIKEIMLEKIHKNAAKYPVDKAKGSAKKYNEL